ILFDRSAFRRELEVELGAGASILVLEAVLFGRVARGETVVRGLFRDRWRVRSEGRLVHAEETAIGPDIGAALAPAAATGGGLAVATLLLVAPDAEERLDAARAALDGPGGASCCRIGSTGKLLARLVAEDGYALRRRLVLLVGLLNGQAGLPNIWTI